MSVWCRLGFHRWDRKVYQEGNHNLNVGIKCERCGEMPWGKVPKRPLRPPSAPPPRAP